MSEKTKIRIQARETVSYRKEMEVDHEHLSNLIEYATGNNGCGSDPSDFNLFHGDIWHGEMDLDSISIDKLVDGEWVSVLEGC